MEKLARIWVFWWAFCSMLCAVIPVPDNGQASRTKPLVFSLACLTVGSAFLSWRTGRNIATWAAIAPATIGTGGMLLAILPNRRRQPWKARDTRARFHEDCDFLRSKPGNLIGLVGLAGLLLFLLIVRGSMQHTFDLAAEARVFAPQLGEFRQLLEHPKPRQSDMQFTGKMLPVRATTGEVELDLWERLPNHLRARTPAEVRLVVEVNTWHAKVGRYVSKNGKGPSGGDAFAWITNVRVIDRGTGTLLGERRFEGEGLPEEVNNQFDRESKLVNQNHIVHYLENLPLR